MKIVVDAMGGDFAPQNVVAGAVEAVKEYGVAVVLVGISERIDQELKKHQYPKNLIEIVHAPEIVAMDDAATVVIRQKRQSSISVGMGLLKKEGYGAFVSAGNTGACVAASTFILGMIPGVDRPGIGCIFPSLKNFTLIIDVGANTAAKPEHLLQYAKMAKIYAREVLGRAQPSIGLLNIGEEECKGTDLEKEAHKLLEEQEPLFIGNLEANEVYTGKADCIVCDGYVGNITLKVSEGMMESVGKLLKREICKNPVAILGALLLKISLKDAKKSIDYSEYGGAPLLGVDGIVLISHGRSSPKAIKNAVRVAKEQLEHNVLEKIKKEMGPGNG
ncbi:MAG: phosphate acyltransferase PlsX [Candidatus Omnitrophica bacterium]|nr:phosphate acyltransferase PlsX [Candidatus Omnitrophota bacterium]MDE2010350.1 phosphate acyltransferase PlsX [Candidatus Omnitrophota bacterium]MDE2215437.1 phosphate acyltransferase PlsX [Candidatus Omnitrophota bacterium]